jgi:hypothetical protein
LFLALLFLALLFLALLFRALLFRAGAQGTGYSPPRMSPAFGSSFISLRGAPDALCTAGAAVARADQRPL